MIYPVPKPVRMPKAPKGFRANGPRTKKSGGAMFPKAKNRRYRAFIRSLACELEGKLTVGRMSEHDVRVPDQAGYRQGLFLHRCWGAVTPAHVGEHQAQGAADVACCVPLCQPAHQVYDEHRGKFHRMTGISAKRMQHRAEGYAVRFYERGEG